LEIDASYRSGQGLPEAQKFINMKGKVNVIRPEEIVGRRILLVDDIMTTRGAAHWCSGDLLRAGAAVVNVAVAGRSVDMRELEFIGYSGPM
jgi:predicted amidophosphoribosyltransferase